MPSYVPALTYHERTKHTPAEIRGGDFSLDRDNEPIPWKLYEDLPSVRLADGVRPPPVPALRAVAEPRRDPLAGTGRAGERRRPDLDALTQLCYLSAGVTRRIRRGGRDRLFRAAACTGALYHVDLYVVSGAVPPAAWTRERTIDPGVYHFDPRTLSLDVLREGDYRGVLADATGGYDPVARAPLSVVATSTWWRNAWKYEERTYRHAFWDSGTVLANLLAAAHALDLPAEVVTGFADLTVADLLGVDPDEEAPLAVVPVGADDGVPDAPAVSPIDPATRPLSPEPKEYHLIRDAWTASSLRTGEDARSWRADRPSGGTVGTRSDGGGGRILLDPVDDGRAAKTSLARTVRRRGSCREYDRAELGFRKVSTVLDRALRGPPMDARDPEGPALQFNDAYLVASGVERVPPGAYHYHPDAGEFELLREGEFRDDAARLALDQPLAGDAALCVFFLSDLDAVVDRLGDRGYRVAQLEAALTAGRLYLAAYAHRDLGATGLTFYDDEVTEFFEPRAAGQTPTFLWTLGRPA